MANKNGYTVTRSLYTLHKKHKTLKDGSTIYVRDYMTNNSSNYPSNVFSYGESNFRIATQDATEETRSHNYGDWLTTEDGSTYWTLDDCSDVEESSEDKIELNPNYKSLRDFAYYGSCYEIVKNSINYIIENFPGELYVSNLPAEIRSGGESDDPDIIFGDGNMVFVENPFGIDISSLKKPADTAIKNDIRLFCKSYEEYVILNEDIASKYETIEDEDKIVGIDWKVEEKYTPCYGGDLMAKVLISVNYNPQTGEEDDDDDPFFIYQYYYKGKDYLVCNKKYAGTHIRPQNSILKEFFNNLTDLQKLLLNRNSNPKYTFTIEYPHEDLDDGKLKSYDRTFTWPSNGWNIIVSGVEFQRQFLNPILDLAELYDEYFTNNLWKNLVHDSLKNMDLTYVGRNDSVDSTDYTEAQTKFQSLMYSYGYFFDILKRYIDNIKYTNSITYSSNNNVPNYFLTDADEISGWEVTTPTNGINDDTETSNVEGLYENESKVYTKKDVNIEFEKRLKINSKAIFSRKGTREGIEMLLGLFGFESYDFAKAKYNILPYDEKVTTSSVTDSYYSFTVKYNDDNSIELRLPDLNTEYDLYEIIQKTDTSSSHEYWSGIVSANTYTIMAEATTGNTGDTQFVLKLINGPAYDIYSEEFIETHVPFYFTTNCDLYLEKGTYVDSYSGRCPTCNYVNYLDTSNVPFLFEDSLEVIEESEEASQYLLTGKYVDEEINVVTYYDFDDLPDEEKIKYYDYKLDEYVCVAHPKKSKHPDKLKRNITYTFETQDSTGFTITIPKLNTDYYLKDCIDYVDGLNYPDNFDEFKVRAIEYDSKYYLEVAYAITYDIETDEVDELNYLAYPTKDFKILIDDLNSYSGNPYSCTDEFYSKIPTGVTPMFIKEDFDSIFKNISSHLLTGTRNETTEEIVETPTYIFDYYDTMPLETFNKYKLSYIESNDDLLQGLPVNYHYFSDTSGYTYKYVVPWYDSSYTFDGDLYYQMNGGWGKISSKQISNSLTDLTEIKSTKKVPFYLETIKSIKLLTSVIGLKELNYDTLKNKTIVKVVGGGDFKTLIENAFDYEFSDDFDTSNFSEYFYLEDRDNYEHYGTYTDTTTSEEKTGWINVPLDDIKNGKDAGLLVLYMESIVDNNKGNNPHSGYNSYDDGKEYFEYFKQLFKYSIENSLFNSNAYDCDNEDLLPEIKTQGFDNLFNSDGTVNYIKDNQKCWYFENIRSEEKGIARAPILMKKKVINPDIKTTLIFDSTSFEELVHTIGGYSRKFFDSDLVPFDFEGLTDDEEYRYGTDVNCSYSIMNTKKLKIEFVSRINTSMGYSYDSQLRQHLEESVIPYLTQLIPSSCIFELVLPEVLDSVELDVASASNYGDDTPTLNNKYVDE